jgi:uncharacterized protein
MADNVLTEHQSQVASRVLAEEGARRRHLVVSLSGAHAYGFPSPDSDLDLKAVHVESTERLLGLRPPPAHSSRLETLDDVEIDYSSNEIGGVLASLFAGNGNYFERFLSAIPLEESSDLRTLRPLVRGVLSRRVHRHYAGFARGQLHEWEKTGYRSAKKLLYVLRTTLTGRHLLVTGELITDLTLLAPRYQVRDVEELIEAKKRGERSELTPEIAERWRGEVGLSFEALDAAVASSVLPEEPSPEDALEEWLVALRRRS